MFGILKRMLSIYRNSEAIGCWSERALASVVSLCLLFISFPASAVSFDVAETNAPVADTISEQAIVASSLLTLHSFALSAAASFLRTASRLTQKKGSEPNLGVWDFGMRDEGSMEFVTRKAHEKFNKKLFKVLSRLAEGPLHLSLKEGRYGFRAAVRDAKGLIEIDNVKMWIELDGALVIIHPDFHKLNHAGRDEFAVYAESPEKARHELSELRASARYAIDHGFAFPEEILKGYLGSIYRTFLNGYVQEKRREEQRERFEPIINDFHKAGIAAEKNPARELPPIPELVQLLVSRNVQSSSFKQPMHLKGGHPERDSDWIIRQSAVDAILETFGHERAHSDGRPWSRQAHDFARESFTRHMNERITTLQRFKIVDELDQFERTHEEPHKNLDCAA